MTDRLRIDAIDHEQVILVLLEIGLASSDRPYIVIVFKVIGVLVGIPITMAHRCVFDSGARLPDIRVPEIGIVLMSLRVAVNRWIPAAARIETEEEWRG